MPKIRQEINIEDSTVVGVGKVQLDTTQYNGTVTYYLEVVALVSSGTATATLAVPGGGAAQTTITTISATTYTRYRSAAFTPTSATLTLECFISGGTGATMKACRIIVLQDNTILTNTETQIEIGAQQTGNVNTVAAPLTNPKYWYYDSSKWNGTLTFYAECTNFQTGSGVITIKLQEDNGSFASWADKVTIVNAATPASITRTRSASFTPTTGRNYRIVGFVASSMDTWAIYNAKIIVAQTDTGNLSGSTTANISSSGDSSGTAQAQAFQSANGGSVTGVKLRLNIALGTPGDSVKVDLVSTLGGSSLAQGTISNTSLTSSLVVYTITFGASYAITANTTYYIQVTRTGATDGSNFYGLGYNTSGLYPNGNRWSLATGTWSENAGTDVYFELTGITGITKLESQYLLANAAIGAGTGLQDYDTYYDPAEWSSVTNVYIHEANNVAAGTSDVKLQSDPNGTPADVTNSTVTNIIEREQSSAMTMPGAAATLDVNQTGT